jgi:hypothetical protein
MRIFYKTSPLHPSDSLGDLVTATYEVANVANNGLIVPAMQVAFDLLADFNTNVRLEESADTLNAYGGLLVSQTWLSRYCYCNIITIFGD